MEPLWGHGTYDRTSASDWDQAWSPPPRGPARRARLRQAHPLAFPSRTPALPLHSGASAPTLLQGGRPRLLWPGFQEAGPEICISVQGAYGSAWEPRLGKEGRMQAEVEREVRLCCLLTEVASWGGWVCVGGSSRVVLSWAERPGFSVRSPTSHRMQTAPGRYPDLGPGSQL